MKTLYILVFLNALNITIKCNEVKDGKIVLNPKYPKKSNVMKSKIKIINARKFENLPALESRKSNTKKKHVTRDSYTVFPPISEKKLFEVPDSGYFIDDVIDRKPRVKKVLPEYGFIVVRDKRSVKDDIIVNDNITRRTGVRKKVLRKRRTKDSKKKLRARISKSVAGGVNENDNKTKNVKHAKKRSTYRLKYTENVNKNAELNAKEVQKLNKNKKAKRVGRKRRQERKDISRRLIAGKDAVIQDYPYAVSIQKNNEHWCAGALLNPRLVITTANCIWKARSVSRMRIRAGSRNMDRGGQVARIQEVVKHPDWSIRSHPDNDVGLLLLDRNLKFSDSVHGVDLPNRAMWPAFEDVWVTSWGSDRRDGIFQTDGVTLQAYHAKLVDRDRCNNITQRFGVVVTRNFICVAQTGRRAPCTRDTGAPAVSDGILWGLASWGIRKLCGTERFPAMFSYTASRSNLDFITNATHYLMSDKRNYPYPDRFVVNEVETTSISATTPFF
ncbi:transmembrane protease serine 11D-like [Melitaea cinxia]|uniref:transmembrane protease serine 11D-like n=1 Tax=Melitaea cinxia TaxID=113334 RepID=UPI001E272E7D|nr:transmembrane protease serine 11D-like [Melitaea cinxia]